LNNIKFKIMIFTSR